MKNVYKTETFTIRNWDIADRPREKLSLKGCDTLTDAELIAILIGSGNKNESALDLAKRILASCNYNLNKLSQLSLEQLKRFKGIGEAKAVSIITGLELGRRLKFESDLKIEKITGSKDVFELMHPILRVLKHEEFWVLYLNNSNKVLYKLQLSKGGLTGTLVDIRLLLKKALDLLATGLILCHNHPSGSLKPSKSDKTITQKIKLATENLDIKVYDHLIITEKSYFSFVDNNIL